MGPTSTCRDAVACNADLKLSSPSSLDSNSSTRWFLAPAARLPEPRWRRPWLAPCPLPTVSRNSSNFSAMRVWWPRIGDRAGSTCPTLSFEKDLGRLPGVRVPDFVDGAGDRIAADFTDRSPADGEEVTLIFPREFVVGLANGALEASSGMAMRGSAAISSAPNSPQEYFRVKAGEYVHTLAPGLSTPCSSLNRTVVRV